MATISMDYEEYKAKLLDNYLLGERVGSREAFERFLSFLNSGKTFNQWWVSCEKPSSEWIDILKALGREHEMTAEE